MERPLVGAFEERAVWHADEGFFYRVATLCVTAAGTVLAFIDARLAPPDGSPCHILLKRSVDGGRTWSESIKIASAAGGNHMNPQPIQDRRSGIIYLFYARRLSFQETNVYLRTSTDDGLTWSRPSRVDTILKDHDLRLQLDLLRGAPPPGFEAETTNAHLYGRRFLVPTPGNSIQLRADHPMAPNRLIVPIFAIKDRDPSLPASFRGYGDMTLLSDDGGQSWQAGGVIPIGHYGSNECVVLERASGRLLLNARTALGENTRRSVAESADGGMTWTTPHLDGALPHHCWIQAGLCRLTHPADDPQGINRVLYSFPDSLQRENMTVLLSYDEGASWPVRKVIHPGPAKYSNLAVLPDQTILLLYGKDHRPGSTNELSISIARFTLLWLTDGKDAVA